jgi:predicted ATPase with chaperone activity
MEDGGQIMNGVSNGQAGRATDLPGFISLDGLDAPECPRDLKSTGIDRGLLADLALKTAQALPQCTTQWIAGQMLLPIPLAEELLEGLVREHLLEVLGHEGPFNHRYSVTSRGQNRAQRISEVCGYVGPAPVSLEAYTETIHYQHSRFPEVSLEDVQTALADLVLPPDDVLTAALAVMSQRSLFLFGPPGNGKTSMARMLHNVRESALWVPHAVAVGGDIIRIFDPQLHLAAEYTVQQPWKIDQRWVRIARPIMVAGGEMTIDSLELQPGLVKGFYEAPLHIKSNGGTFVLDDLGRQRVEPVDLLNRWIIPLEHGFDFFTLRSGAKIRMPFQQMLIVATNLDPDRVMDPAFMRRMGYRIHLETPTQQRFREIFHRYAEQWRVSAPEQVIEALLERYRHEGRDLRGCEPRDLIGRVQDICRLRRQPLELSDELLDLAWASYFGARSCLSQAS